MRAVREGQSREVQGFSRGHARATTVFRLDCLEMRGLCFLYARALEEQGIPIDMICGTSIGSIIAAVFATGKDSAGILAACERHFRRLVRFYLPDDGVDDRINGSSRN